MLGVCEHDPQEPATVMISLNGELLGCQPEMLRSTAAHELGHAIFYMPAAVAKGSARAFRSGVIAARDAAPIDWREWRCRRHALGRHLPIYAASSSGVPLGKACFR